MAMQFINRWNGKYINNAASYTYTYLTNTLIHDMARSMAHCLYIPIIVRLFSEYISD